ncbi:MAG: amidase family protein [Spirosomataceae bacterium]
MKPSTKKILKWTGITVGSVVLIVLAFGIYLYSILPKPIGTPPTLQAALFQKPIKPLPMEGKYIYKSATELAAMIRHKEATSMAVVKEHLAHIKNNNWKYNALIWLREAEALQEAQLADEAVAKGDTLKKPLLGVPVTIKEMFWVKGSPSTMNVKMMGFIAPRDGEAVQQIKSSGAIVLGTTNVPYMLSDYQTQGEVYPTGNNPYDTTRTPGGSTGGGAAALAAGFSSLELGSDLGGSIRVPAAFCGLYALKPTFGSVNISQSTGPDTTTKFTRMALASAGPLARHAEDLELMWHIIRETKRDERFQQKIDRKPASTKALNRYKVAWMDEWKHGNETVQVSQQVKEKLKQLTNSLSTNGVALRKDAPDTYNDMFESFLGSFASMMGEGQPWLLRKLIALDFKKMDNGSPHFNAFYEAMGDASPTKWNQIEANRKVLINKWETFFKQYDFFVCPITYDAAFPKCAQGSLLKGDNGKLMPYMNYFPYSYIFNATGHPCVIVPMGLNQDGLPIGLQIVGSYHSEEELLRFTKLISPLTSGFVKPKNL